LKTLYELFRAVRERHPEAVEDSTQAAGLTDADTEEAFEEMDAEFGKPADDADDEGEDE
jgi:hypothetical protein